MPRSASQVFEFALHPVPKFKIEADSLLSTWPEFVSALNLALEEFANRELNRALSTLKSN